MRTPFAGQRATYYPPNQTIGEPGPEFYVAEVINARTERLVDLVLENGDPVEAVVVAEADAPVKPSGPFCVLEWPVEASAETVAAQTVVGAFESTVTDKLKIDAVAEAAVEKFASGQGGDFAGGGATASFDTAAETPEADTPAAADTLAAADTPAAADSTGSAAE